ncbi:MAG: arginine--tRNA ligase, partial [Clostridia bacterium]|nr:arginine--tRNA ligase [Clostridia bacterium]
MNTLKRKTALKLAALVSELYPGASLSAEELAGMLEFPPDPAMGDLALPCFKLSRSLHASPVQIADALA